MRILIVEDNPINLAILTGIVSKIPDCVVESHTDPMVALRCCWSGAFDLVLVDYIMPRIDGLTFIRELRRDPMSIHIPIIMITGAGDRALKIEAIEHGATDFLNKPVDPQELKVRVTNLLALRRAQVELSDRAKTLVAEVARATHRILEREEEVIWRLARAIEFVDEGTRFHISRVAEISQIIAMEMGLELDQCRTIYLAAPLHDVGKIAVPDSIRNKPGKLTEPEMATMRTHVTVGAEILSDGSSELVRVAERIALSHHERWDGTGYPFGLAGKAIPLEGRVVAVADVFDALCTERSYKKAWNLEAARAEILAQNGRHFDPDCVAAFERGWPQIATLMCRYASSISAA